MLLSISPGPTNRFYTVTLAIVHQHNPGYSMLTNTEVSVITVICHF
ncbi:hypothetical protein [Leptothermofonsia sp. ETS-13]